MWAGWDKCLCQDSIWGGHLLSKFASGFHLSTGVPGRSRVSKVGSEGRPKMAFNAGHATGPSPRGSLGLGARQVKTKTYKPTSKVSLLCFALQRKSTLPIHARQTGHQPLQQQWARPRLSSQWWRVGLLFCGIFHHGTILQHLLGTIHLHWPRPKRQQGRAFLGWLHHQPPWNLLPSLF